MMSVIGVRYSLIKTSDADILSEIFVKPRISREHNRHFFSSLHRVSKDQALQLISQQDLEINND